MEAYINSTTMIVVYLVAVCIVGFMVISLKGENIISLFIGGMCLSIFILFNAAPSGDEINDEAKGRYYATQCQLIETNIDNGLFQSNTNKLKCGEVIENVTVSDDQTAMAAYKKSYMQR